MKVRALMWTLMLISVATFPLSAQQPKALHRSPLDDYIHKADPVYGWEVIKSIDGEAVKTTIIKLRSQSWRNEKEVNRTVWEHAVVISKPKKLTSKTAFLMIGGGSNERPMPDKADVMTSMIAASTGSIVVELKMVPNQPLIFNNDGVKRVEDDLLGYGWAKFLETGDATWVGRLPMVKSAVRCMDCIQEWAQKEGTPVEKFVVAGGSKRGWTTWLTGATDPRVEAIVPIVIDVLNSAESIKHHGEAYGFWAMAIGNYYQHNILQRQDHPRMQDLYKIEDPLSYKDRLTLPKYVVNAAGDQFFLPDSSQFYYDELKGEKLLRYVANADHGLKDSDALQSITAYHHMVINGKPRPEYSWTFEQDGSIKVKYKTPPSKVVLWQATNANTRDFRVDTIGKAYTSTELKQEADGSFVGKITPPEKGWTAFFVELTYDVGAPFPLKVTTSVRVLPDVLPHKGADLNKMKYEGEVFPEKMKKR
ncbi:MAG: PhoPQ-activated pathogenicity-related family protein [Planctomycetia bacterium]|nr:PhoPQ-activated pathogenicity-related family protein [Planctomycetia bacterium]